MNYMTFEGGIHSTNANFKFRNVKNCPLLLRILAYLKHFPGATRRQILAACNDPRRVRDLEYANHEILPSAWDAGIIAPVKRSRAGYHFCLAARGFEIVEKAGIAI